MKKADNEQLLGWAELVSIFAVFIYFTGFIFRYFYLYNFGIGLNEVSDSLYSIFIFSFNIFLYFPIVSSLACLGVAIAVFFRRKGFWPNVLSMAYLLLSFFILYNLAHMSADRSSWDARYSALQISGKKKDLRHILKPVDVLLKSKNTASPALWNAIQNHDLYRLLTTDKVLFALVQPVIPDPSVTILSNATVYRINLDDIQSYSVERIDVDPSDNSISD